MMRYHVSNTPTPNPNIIVDNLFSSSSVFAVVAYALTSDIDTISINALSGKSLHDQSSRVTIFTFSTLPEYCKLYTSWCHSKRAENIPFGIAGAAWSIFGHKAIARIAQTEENIDTAWSIIDNEIVSKFDHTEFANQLCRIPSNRPIITEDFETACTILECWLRLEIRNAVKI